MGKKINTLRWNVKMIACSSTPLPPSVCGNLSPIATAYHNAEWQGIGRFSLTCLKKIHTDSQVEEEKLPYKLIQHYISLLSSFLKPLLTLLLVDYRNTHNTNCLAGHIKSESTYEMLLFWGHTCSLTPKCLTDTSKWKPLPWYLLFLTMVLGFVDPSYTKKVWEWQTFDWLTEHFYINFMVKY